MKTNFNFKTPKTLFYSFFAIAFIAVACLTSCSKDNVNGTAAPASVMAVNSAQASAPQDFYVDNNKQNTSAIAYTQSTGYFVVGNGDHQIQFKTSATTTVNASLNASFAPGGFYSVYYADDNTTNTYQNDRTMPGSGNSRVRFINLSSAMTANVDFASTIGTKSTAVVSGLAHKAASSYSEVSSNSTFTLSASGSSSVLLNIPATLQAGHIYSIVISGTTSATLAFTIVAEN
jgi:hypothetical protein